MSVLHKPTMTVPVTIKYVKSRSILTKDLQELLRVCSVTSNSILIMIGSAREDRRPNFLSFCLGAQVLKEVTKVRYLGYIIRNNHCDDN